MADKEIPFKFPTQHIPLTGDSGYSVAKILHVVSPVDFYVRFKKEGQGYFLHDPAFEAVDKEVNRVYQRLALDDKTLAPLLEVNMDDHCVYRHSSRGFYRGRVVAVKKDRRAHLVDVDCGDVDTWVTPDRIFPVVRNAVIRQTHMFGIRCKLANVVSPDREGWTEDLVDDFMKYYAEREFHCEIIGREVDTYVVNMYYIKSGRDVTDHMGTVGIGRRPRVPKPPPSLPFLEIDARIGGKVPVIVCYVESGARFFVQLAGNADLITKFSVELNFMLDKKGDTVPDPKVEKGQFCAAKYSVDTQWYRAVILSRLSPTKVEVLFVDYGNKDRVCVKDMKALVSDFMKYPAQAIECRLSNVDTDIDTKTLRHLAENKKLMIKIDAIQTNSVLMVTLYQKCRDGQDFIINDFMAGRTNVLPAEPAKNFRRTLPAESAYPESAASSRSAAAAKNYGNVAREDESNTGGGSRQYKY